MEAEEGQDEVVEDQLVLARSRGCSLLALSTSLKTLVSHVTSHKGKPGRSKCFFLVELKSNLFEVVNQALFGCLEGKVAR